MTNIPPTPDGKLEELEALRGLLAVWVLVAHVTSRIVSDATIANAHFRALLEPLTPVYVFMILSGFVIAMLLARAPSDYGPFIIRRVFRLAPLYLCVLAAAALLVPFELNTLDHLFMRNLHIYDAIKVHHETLAQFWPHFWAHAFLVHGLIPDTVLPDANFTFLSQGWSVSLEMQYYLLAPLVMLLITRRHFVLLALLAAALAGLGMLGVRSTGFLPNQLHWFAIGIASFCLYAWRAHWIGYIPRQRHGILLLLVCGTTYLVVRDALPVLIWIVVLDILLAGKTGAWTGVTRALQALLRQPVLQWLGRISYSVYLVHIPVLYVVFRIVTRLNEHIGGWKFLALALPGTLLLTIGIASITYAWIERPGMKLGSRLAKRWTERGAACEARARAASLCAGSNQAAE